MRLNKEQASPHMSDRTARQNVIMSTVFTKIISGEFPGSFVWSDHVAVAFASIDPISPGHQLVVPRAEVDRFTELDEDTAAHLFTVAQRIGRAIERAFDAPRACLLIAGFEVPHTHLHVLPVWDQSRLSFAYAQPAEQEELVANAQKVRESLRALGYGAHVPPSIDSAAHG